MRATTRFALFLAFLPAIASAQLTISRPNDSVVNGTKADISGSGVADGTSVSVKVNGVTKTTTAAGGSWSVAGMSLAKGDNVVTAMAGTATSRALAVRSHAMTAQGVQQVFFQWDADVDEELRRIASGTLSATLTEDQLATFVTRVRARTQEIYAERYGPFAVEIVNTAGLNVHTIHMTAIDDTIYGSSPSDCGSDTPRQTSTVHVGTYRDNMISNLSSWRPMQQTDTLETRIEDVAQALGRTTTHETGHSFGLVAGSGTCGWMRGCKKGHNCPSYDVSQPLANRFDSGRHIMDPGGDTFNRFRIAEPNSGSRAPARVPSTWEPFGRSYLSIVHPPGGP